MFGLRVEATLHWGFWCRSPSTSKLQTSLYIFPPTTLIGALCAELARRGVLKLNGMEIKGETLAVNGKFSSPSLVLAKAVAGASAYYKEGTIGFAYEDISKYVTLHFHQFQNDGRGIRRYLPEYRSGAIRVGKISVPSGAIVICYLLYDKILEELIGNNWEREILIAACSIDRLGSKESIVSIEKSEPMDAKPLKDNRIETRLYFPLKYVDQHSIEGSYYSERFWKGGWTRGDTPDFEEFLIPGSKTPIRSGKISACLKGGIAYRFKHEEVLVV
ncbi:type I-A CRISPR-associated protein Cas5 [Candidatus Bathyarchaeota archaeon A05DMB-2]|jgi:CRISPR-associated protein Cas5 subtype I-A|nr:type I-A CRISPR-associated protein Cas5 [Candidatus Bathyarchaeota archaeon A05DMB-2]